MATVGARIRRARLALGMSQEELAARVGRTRVAISEWERDISRPREAIIPLLAQVLRVPEANMTPWGSGGITPIDQSQRSFTIPIILWDELHRVARGVAPMEVAAAQLPVELHEGVEDEFAVRVADHSMAPEFAVGDTLIINQALDPWDGCCVVVMMDGDEAAMMRRYTIRRERAIDLIPDSPDYPVITLSADRTATIIGVVVAHTRSLRPAADA